MEATLLISLLLPCLVLPAAPTASAREITITSFEDGRTRAEVAFGAAGTDLSLSISMQTGMRTSWAFINISGAPYTGGGKDCPLSPSLDLGADGEPEWRFNGTGYGALGHQYLFPDGSASFQAVFPAAGLNDSMAIRLPAGSTIIDASFDLVPSGFAGPSVSVSVDVGTDGVADWSNSTLAGKASVPGIASLIGSYLSDASPSGADQYGVRYVDVPVRLSCGSAATLSATNLSVRYDVTLTTTNLALKLLALVPGEPGTGNVSVPVRLASGSAGRIIIKDIALQVRPPLHAPDLLDPDPPLSPELFIDENRSARFSVRVQDIYGDPVTLQWFLDLVPVPGETGTSFTLLTNYSSAGRHSVTVTAANDLSEGSLTWWVNVADVNRPPVIRGFAPHAATVGEGFLLNFSVDAYDPDGGQTSYAWYLDGARQSEPGPTWSYRPQLGDAGYHDVDLTVGDVGGGSANLSWNVLVKKTNVAPTVVDFSPASDPVVAEGQALQFRIAASDPNGDPLTYEWVLDGYSAGFGATYNYTPDFSAAGVWVLRALVSDGVFTAGRTWNITVTDVNHAPAARMDRPREGEEYLDTDIILLSARNSTDQDRDPLAFRWYDGETAIAEGVTANVSLTRGPHSIRLVVEDGKGGKGELAVNITVRTVSASTEVSLSPGKPREGERIRIKVVVTNEGDTAMTSVPLELQMDGVRIGGRTVARILPGDNATEFFFWTAEPGRHDLSVSVGNQTSVLYVSVAPGVPAFYFWILMALGAGLIAMAVSAVHFSIQWRRAIREGIIDEGKRRGRRKDQDRGKGQEERKPLGFFNIRLGASPYKERPLEIQTTMPEDRPPQDNIREELTPVRRHYLARQPAPPGKGGPAPSPRGSPVTAGLFAARRSERPLPPPPEASDVELPVAHPAPPESKPSVPSPPPKSKAKLPPPPPPGKGPAPEEPGRAPKKRMKAVEDRLHDLEGRGMDIAAPRRFASLAASFFKGGNVAKADQYLAKAEAKLDELEKEARPAKAEGPTCRKCGAEVDPAWIVCPECEAMLK